MERLQKVIANSGYCSRRKAEELIVDGSITINGSVAHLGDKVKNSDVIKINGKVLETSKDEKVYILLNKPRGVVTTSSDDLGRKTVLDLIDCPYRVYPVGRLDYDTTGALLLTNDGELTNLLTHPKNHVDKTYIAKVKGIINGRDVKTLENGVMIDNFKTSKCRVKLKKYDKETFSSLVEITIHEGHNHQVKKMFEAIGYDVIKLTRISFAGLRVNSLKSGEYKYLSIKEAKQLYGLVNSKKGVE